MIYLMTRIGWPPLLWFQHVCSALVPVMYIFNPPTSPPRETLLVRDEATQIAYPRLDARVVKKSRELPGDIYALGWLLCILEFCWS
ncbi:hypothetical protein DM02DRAFT_411368 [Periconia macrospinosa]|uniref:Protein kinase domain-containing protein n=1 Tax=Periconia macrospinosa TaxID=97972 RepID=A0A2V1DP71_9PLEO|nr:hypothetical protein DM02DRAFT_411368 [Periconia macrospinosa]